MSSSTLQEWVSATPERQRVFAQEALIVDVAEEIWAALEEEQLSKADLAARLDKSKAFITQILNGSRNMTLRTLADVATALGRKIFIRVSREAERGQWEHLAPAFVSDRSIVPMLSFECSNDSNWQDIVPLKKVA
jgi:transcriptional regulator with XRE-family HTH domain